MKYLIFIFAFYFAGLTAMPCNDAAASHGDCGTELSGPETADQHQGESPEEENCSPFCTCHCCKIQKVGIVTSEAISISAVRESKDPLTPPLLSKDFFSVWHPPKA